MKDLSHMLDSKTGLTAGESMSGGNTISERPKFTPEGSTPVNPDPANPKPHDDPSMDGTASSHMTKLKATNNVTSEDATWKKAGD